MAYPVWSVGENQTQPSHRRDIHIPDFKDHVVVDQFICVLSLSLSFFLSFGQAMGEGLGPPPGVNAQPVLGMISRYPSWFQTCWDPHVPMIEVTHLSLSLSLAFFLFWTETHGEIYTSSRIQELLMTMELSSALRLQGGWHADGGSQGALGALQPSHN